MEKNDVWTLCGVCGWTGWHTSFKNHTCPVCGKDSEKKREDNAKL